MSNLEIHRRFTNCDLSNSIYHSSSSVLTLQLKHDLFSIFLVQNKEKSDFYVPKMTAIYSPGSQPISL